MNAIQSAKAAVHNANLPNFDWDVGNLDELIEDLCRARDALARLEQEGPGDDE